MNRQEQALRWSLTAVFVGCGVAFCWSLGDVAVSSSLGLFFGLLIAGVPGALLWGRELHEMGIRADRAMTSRGSSLPFRAEVDETTPQPRPVDQRARTASYYDDEDD